MLLNKLNIYNVDCFPTKTQNKDSNILSAQSVRYWCIVRCYDNVSFGVSALKNWVYGNVETGMSWQLDNFKELKSSSFVCMRSH